MKKNSVLSVAILAVPLAILAGLMATGETSRAGNPLLPASLDQLYPPHAEGPMYLFAMHDLNVSLASMVGDLFEDDMDNAMQNFGEFKVAYERARDLVPEWQSRYPQESLTSLETALKGGSRDQVMGAIAQVDLVCHSCHVEYMPAVQFRYHWTDFGAISVTDPLTGQETGFRQFKLMVNMDLVGIGNDLAQGQLDQARQHAAGLASRFEVLSGLCEACHDSKPKYYVSEDIQAQLDTLRLVLDDAAADPAAVGALAQHIGVESCSKCHLVHIPGAYSQY
jgi:cytochrome c556